MSRTDVIILGGGIIGCALAEELARRGRRVIVVERGRIGAEASSAAAGILSSQMDVPEPGPFFDLCQEARRIYPAWIRRLERASGVAVDYQQRGVLYLAMTRAQTQRMRHRAKWQRARRLPVEEWTPAQVRRHEPAIDGAVQAGFYFPREAQVDNPRVMDALAIACRHAGVMLKERTAVRRVLTDGHAVQGVETHRGTLRAPVVVNCLGSWAAMGGRFPVRVPVEPARGQILVFQGTPRMFGRPVMSDRAYVVQRRDGRLLVGSTIERVGFEKALTVQGMHAILCGARRFSSRLNDRPFLEAWAGLRPLTPDGLPILGKTSIDGLLIATGHFRHGILLAPVTAQLMSELLLTGRSGFDLARFLSVRFQDFPIDGS